MIEEFLGGHAMLVVGYDDEGGYLIVRNSWVEQWGDNGYCYLPYEYYTNGLIVDMWVGLAE